MPRGQWPKKDAESGETWTGSCKRAMSRPNPNGATQLCASTVTGGGIHRPSGGTAGTETSQYREEEESSEIPVVVASEPGTAQTDESGNAPVGVVGPT